MLTCSHGHINVFVRVETIQCVHAASVGSWKSAGPMFTQKPQCVVYLYLRYLKRCMIKMNRPFSIAFHCGCILPFIWWINCAYIPYILSLGCTVHVSHYCHVYALLANGFICIFPWFNIQKKKKMQQIHQTIWYDASAEETVRFWIPGITTKHVNNNNIVYYCTTTVKTRRFRMCMQCNRKEWEWEIAIKDWFIVVNLSECINW